MFVLSTNIKTMKKVLFLTALILFVVIKVDKAKAQGGFGGVHAGSEFTSSGNLLLLGGGGAWVINSSFYLGGAGYGGSNTLATTSGELSSIGYGGLMIGYFKEVKESFRIGGDVLSGSGGYTVDTIDESFFFIEPNLKIWYSINSFLHLSAGVYYRIAYVNADAVLNQQELNNFGVKLSLNFGSL
jgi:hypothetical protein